MSPSGAVAARLATARHTRDPSTLTTTEAEADAVAALREAAPHPGRDLDNIALADVSRMFVLRQRAGGADIQPLLIAMAVAGVLPPDADVGLTDAERAWLGSKPQPWRYGTFAHLAANAHGDLAAESESLAERLAALEAALAWSGRAREMLGQAGDPDQLAEMLAYRIRLLNLQAELAADPGAWREAADAGRALVGLLSPPQPAHGPYLVAAAEAIAQAALLLGDPSLGEAEHAAALVPAGHQAVIAPLLNALRSAPEDPVTWPGEPDARAGYALLGQGQAAARPDLLAAASWRLRAALAVAPSGHPARPALAQEIRNAAVAFAVVGGPGLPADAVLAAFVMDLCQAAGEGSWKLGSAVTDGWLAGYESAFARLPPGHPRSREYAMILAAASGTRAELIRPADPGRAARLAGRARQVIDGVALPPQCAGMRGIKEGHFAMILVNCVYLTPWPELAASLTAPGQSAVARDLADGFGLMDQVFGGPDGLTGAMRDLLFLDLSPDGDSARAETYSRISALAEQIPDDRRASRAALIASLGANLSGAAIMRLDPEIAHEAVDLMLRAFTIDPGVQENPGWAAAFAAALTFDPVRLLRQWDAEYRLAATALLARVQVTGEDTGSVLAALGKAIGEIRLAAMNLLAQSELSQLPRIRDLADRVRDLARQAGPIAEQVVLENDMFVDVAVAYADVIAALPESQGAQAHAVVVEGLRQKLDALPAEHPAHPTIEAALGVALRMQAQLSRVQGDPIAEQALAAEAESHINHALAAMATRPAALAARYLGPGNPLSFSGEREEMRAAFSRAALDPEAFLALMSDPRIDVRDRVHEGLSTAIEVTGRGGIRRGLDYAELAVELMSQVTDRGYDHESAEHAFAWLRPGYPERYVSGLLWSLRQARQQGIGQSPEPAEDLFVARAAALAERARGVLLARQFESRTDLVELEAAYPGLAGEYARLVTWLGADPDTLAGLRPASSPPTTGRAEWARLEKLHLSREMDALVERIRDAPGFDDFQRGLGPLRMRALADSGPVVLLTYPGWPGATPDEVHGRPCAFIVTTESIAAFPLNADFKAFDAAAARWRAAIADITARGAQRPGIARLRQARQDLAEVLSWTWHHVTGPVLDAAGLGSGGQTPGGWPRVWWIPDGPLNALPLHAAQCQTPGCQLGRCGSALDLVVSSYVPSFRTLAHARSRAPRDSGGGQEQASGPAVIVAATDEELPGAEAAAREAAGRLGTSKSEIIVGDAATRERVLTALGHATWAHFGCHATSDPRQPSSGTLHLPSGEPLTVREIFAGRPGQGRTGARLAFLTACGTARTSERLASEAIHLTSAFLIAGFTDVIGTLWEIDSVSARQVTSAFYRRVTGPSPEPAAVALHHCSRRVRRQRPAEPHAWAAYIHSGA